MRMLLGMMAGRGKEGEKLMLLLLVVDGGVAARRLRVGVGPRRRPIVGRLYLIKKNSRSYWEANRSSRSAVLGIFV